MKTPQGQLAINTAQTALAAATGESALLAHTLDAWTQGQPLPETEIREASTGAINDLKRRAFFDLMPAGPEATTVSLNRLFSIMAMPDDDALDIWLAEIDRDTSRTELEMSGHGQLQRNPRVFLAGPGEQGVLLGQGCDVIYRVPDGDKKFGIRIQCKNVADTRDVVIALGQVAFCLANRQQFENVFTVE